MKRSSLLSAASAVAVLSLAGVARADPYPHQRLGLWQSDMTMAGHSMRIKSCVDAASEAQTNLISQSIRKNGTCQSLGISHNPDGSWTSTSSCEFRKGVKTTTRAEVSGDFNSHVKILVRKLPSNAIETSMDMTWLGACQAGQKGGDVIMPDGHVVHTLETGQTH